MVSNILVRDARGTETDFIIDRYISNGCHGERLKTEKYDTNTECMTLDYTRDMARSVVTAFDGPEDDILELVTYTDTECRDIYEFSNELTCVANDDNNFNSYRVIFSRVKANRRSPQEIQREVDAMTTDLNVTIETRADDETLGPPKSYDVSTLDPSNAAIAAIGFNHPYLRAAWWSTSTGLTMYGVFATCVTTAGVAIPVSTCVTAVAATSMSFIAAVNGLYESYQHRMATVRGRLVELGMRPGVARGLEGRDNNLMLTHEENMEYILHGYGVKGKHIGLHKRGEDAEEFPAYQFTGHNDIDFVFTIHGDEGGQVGHTISLASHAKIEKRIKPGYQGVTIEGGMDIQACRRSFGGTFNDIQSEPDVLYDYFYDDLACLLNPNGLEGATYISGDIVDEDGIVLITVGMSPYKPGGEYYADIRPACDNTEFYWSSTCVF